MLDGQTIRPSSPGGERPFLTERAILQLGLAMTAGFLALAALSGLLPSGGLHGWVGIHLALAGASTVAIGTFMPHFGVTLAGTNPAPAGLRLAGVVALAGGMVLVTLGRLSLGDRAAAIGGLVVLTGLGLTAYNTYTPLRLGLARRHPIAHIAYGVALADLAVGTSLATALLFGIEPIVLAWSGLKAAHVWLNAVGFVSLTIAGTLIYLYPTMLGARIRPHVTMVAAVAGLAAGPPIVALAAWLGSSPVAIAGAAVTLIGAIGLLGYGLDVWRRRGTWASDLAWHDLSARHGLAGMAWFVAAATALLIGLVRDGVAVPGWTIGSLAVPLIGGWVLQELIGAAGHLLPAVGPGDVATKARQRRLLSRSGTARVTAWNVGLALLWPGIAFKLPIVAVSGAMLFGVAAVGALMFLITALVAGLRPR